MQKLSASLLKEEFFCCCFGAMTFVVLVNTVISNWKELEFISISTSRKPYTKEGVEINPETIGAESGKKELGRNWERGQHRKLDLDLGLRLYLPCKRKEKRILTSVLHVWINKFPLWCFLEIILKGLSNFAIALDIKLVTKGNT